MSLAREAYEAYCLAADGKSLVTGDPLPSWEMLPEKIQHAWLISATWVAGKVTGHHDWKEPLKDREIDRLRQALQAICNRYCRAADHGPHGKLGDEFYAAYIDAAQALQPTTII